jgi:predicted PurR-regulated permease PerM
VANGNRTNGNAKTQTLLVVLIVIAVLFFARTIFIPLALSILLTFMLAPVIIRLRHWGLGRIPAAIIVVLLALGVIGVVGSVMASQLADLAHQLPEYQHNVHEKVESIRGSGGGLVKRISGTVQKLSDELTPPSPPSGASQRPEERPVPVEIRRAPFSPVELVQKILGSLVGILLTASIVIVFVIFMLIERDELRDRLIRLAGAGQVNVTTNVLDDAARRVSRYLLAQFVINAAYGALTGTTLYFIHIPNPLLWGLLAALLRYVPYLGIWVAALAPAAVALAVRPGWVEVPMIFGIYGGVDLLMYNFAEPVLYGSSTGLSPLAVLVAAVFWTWLWGPAGLLLATPLTVCVVSIGRHVPRLAFLQVLLSDEPVLPPETRLYQRLLAMDLEEASLLSEECLKASGSLDRLYDELIVPALNLAEEDRHHGKLDEAKEQFVYQKTHILVEDMAERADELLAVEAGAKTALLSTSNDSPKIVLEPTGPIEVLCIPARDEADELAAYMFKLMLQKRGIAAKALTARLSVPEVTEEIERSKPKAACVVAVPPFARMHTRYLCRRVRHEFKDLKLVVAFLTGKDADLAKPGSGLPAADETAATLSQAAAAVASLTRSFVNDPAPSVLK